MKANRFSFGPPPAPKDSEIVKKSSMLKVYLYREDDGDLSGSFTLEGSFGNLSWQGDQTGVDDGLQFVRELMRQFSQKPDSGEAAAS